MKLSRGFTLIELLIVIALVAIVAGVSADIVLSIVRSYTKTRVQTEVEQSANFALLKLEKELKSATSLINPPSPSSNSITFERGGSIITYQVLANGTLERVEGTDTAPLLDAVDPNGVKITSAGGGNTFTVLHNNPYVIQIKMTLAPVSVTGVAFEGDVEINQTVVLRGTYN